MESKDLKKLLAGVAAASLLTVSGLSGTALAAGSSG